MKFVSLVALTLSTVGLSTGFAGTPSAPPQVGDKVRIDFTREEKGETAPILRMHQITGLLAYADTSAWRIHRLGRQRPGRPPLETNLAVSDFERVRISDGRSDTNGAWIGAGFGLFAGAVAAVLAGKDPEGGIFERGWLPFGVLIPLGTAAGAVTGQRMGADRWREYPVRDVFSMETVGEQP